MDEPKSVFNEINDEAGQRAIEQAEAEIDEDAASRTSGCAGGC